MTTDQRTAAAPRRGVGLRFLGGMALGVIILCSLGVAGVVALDVAERAGPSKKVAPTQLMLNGAEASRRGGVRIALNMGWSLIRQDCHGSCDDLSTDQGAVRSLRVVDTKGSCIACRRYWLLSPLTAADPLLKTRAASR